MGSTVCTVLDRSDFAVCVSFSLSVEPVFKGQMLPLNSSGHNLESHGKMVELMILQIDQDTASVPTRASTADKFSVSSELPPIMVYATAKVLNFELGVKFYSSGRLHSPLAVGLRRGARGPLYRKPSIGRAESWG